MKRVDHMIKYLSGELPREESSAFEKELLEDQELNASFIQVSKAYHLISEQLKLRDEKEFISKLRDVMDNSATAATKSHSRRPRLILLLSLAASIAILVTILLMNRKDMNIYMAYFHPLEDQVILSVSQETRSDYESVASMYARGEFASVIEETSLLLTVDKENPVALLFNLLASIELDLEEESLVRVELFEPDPDHVMGQALAWYRVLALIKAGREEDAMKVLEVLQNQPGPYETDAHKLQKMLTK